jgi:hypothetical protein
MCFNSEMSEAVRNLLDAADARLQKLEREAKRISEEIREVRTKRAAYAEALSALGEHVDPLPDQGGDGQSETRRKRGISGFWQNALKEMERKGRLSVTDVFDLSEKLGSGLTAAAIRSQLSYYSMAPRFVVRRVSPGVYELTDSGKALIAQKGEDPVGAGSSDATDLVESEQTRTVDPGQGAT